MRQEMREDISSLVSSMLHTNTRIDLSNMLTQENMFDASLLRSFLLDFHEDESDFEDFFSDVEMDESFLRGFMAGLVQSIMIERAHGEVIGRLSHAEFVELYDAACAFLMESSV